MMRIKEQVSRMALMNNNVSITVLDSGERFTGLPATVCVKELHVQNRVFSFSCKCILCRHSYVHV